MLQQWLTIGGLGCDFVGFALLLREWWLNFFNEGRQIQLQEQQERIQAMRRLRYTQPGQANPFENLERLQDEGAARHARAAHRQAMAARRGTFILAAALIVAGLVLQIAGAWPM